MQRVLLLLVLAMFSVVTALALWHHGYWGILEPHFKSWGAAQVFMDLVIALGLVVLWMWQDAKLPGAMFGPGFCSRWCWARLGHCCIWWWAKHKIIW
jgi:hypothetical protein